MLRAGMIDKLDSGRAGKARKKRALHREEIVPRSPKVKRPVPARTAGWG